MALLGLAAPTTAQAKTVTLNLGHPFLEKLVTLTSWEKGGEKR